MGQKFAAYDSNGNIYTYYDSIDSPVPDAASTIEITDEQWQACIELPGYTVKNGALVAPTPPTAAEQLGNIQLDLCASIDAAADSAYIQIGGPSPGRLAEYQQANTDAQAFKAAGYTGTVPPTVASWVTASGMTAQAAADNIIATATAWIAVLEAIRDARLVGKKSVNDATTVTDAQAAASAAIANIQKVAASA